MLGAGPAGAAAARLLALWGHRVTVIAKPHHARSFPRRIGPAVHAQVVRCPRRAGGDRPRRLRAIDGEHRVVGIWRVPVRVVRRRPIGMANHRRSPRVAPARRRDRGRRRVRGAPRGLRRRSASAPSRSTARGGAGFSPARGVCADSSPTSRPWRSSACGSPHAPLDVPDATHTLIESYADGWAWSVPDTGGRRFVAVMVDPRTSALHRGDDSREVYLAEIRKTPRFRTLLANATLVAGPSGWDASMYWSERYVDDSALLVGDAGSFIDPLSSAGVKKALASGWLAAVAVHTSLVQPSMQAPRARVLQRA